MSNYNIRIFQLYWELQLLNVLNLNTLNLKDTPVFIDPHVLTDQHQNKNPNDSNKAHNSDDGSSFSCTFDTGSSQVTDSLLRGAIKSLFIITFSSLTFCTQRRRRVGKVEQHRSVRGVKRLKKAARQSWARSASSVQEIDEQRPNLFLVTLDIFTIFTIFTRLHTSYMMVTHS